MRIGIAAMHHETNSFSNIPMTWEEMQKTRFEGDMYTRIYTGIRNYSGGFIVKGRELGVEIIPAASAYLCPSGHITDEALEKHRDGIVELLWKAHQENPLDAIALNLHGAGVADSYPDADGEVLRAVRERFGPDMPIGCCLDLHANVTKELMTLSDILIGCKGYPHVDEFETGAKLMELLVDMVQNHRKFHMHHIQLPWLMVPAEGLTTAGPAHRVQQYLLQLEETMSELLDVSFFHGFPYSDITDACVSVTAVATTQETAQEAARLIASDAWNHRRDFPVSCNSAQQAMELAQQIPITNGPIVINESSDNTGGGTPGDGTYLLREMLRLDLPGSAFASIHDPEVAKQAAEAGVGATIQCKLGGKLDELHGEPIELTAYVRCISDGWYVQQSPMGFGAMRDAGLTACLVVGNVSIIVTSVRGQAMDDGLLRIGGLQYTLLSYVAVKSSQHFKGWWADKCSGIVPCESPGINSADLTVFDFRYTNKNFFPLQEATWD